MNNLYEFELFGYRVETNRTSVDVEDKDLNKLKALLAFSHDEGVIRELLTVRTPTGEIIDKAEGDVVFIYKAPKTRKVVN